MKIILATVFVAFASATALDEANLNNEQMTMSMMMYMTFWHGVEMNFLFDKAMTMKAGPYWLGLFTVFVTAIFFEVLQRIRMYWSRSAVASIAA